VQGLAKPFKQVVYRVGEIGDPKMKIRDRVVEFKQEVGFGGAVVLSVRNAGPLESMMARFLEDRH
jgi:hypothetical protein